MTIPLVVLAGSRARRRRDRPAVRATAQLNVLDRGSSRCCAARPRSSRRRSAPGSLLSTVALVIAIVGIVVGRAVYRNGLDARRRRPERRAARRASRRCSTNALLPRHRPRPVRERPGHRGRALPQRRRRPRRDRRRGQRHRRACSAAAAAVCARCRPVSCATTRSRSLLGAVAAARLRRDAGDAVMLAARAPTAVASRADARLPAAHRADPRAARRRGASRCSCRRGGPSSSRIVGYVTSAATFGLAVYLLVQFDTGTHGYQFVDDHRGCRALGIRWTLGVDGISLFMVALTALLIPIGLLASAELEKPKSFTFWMLLLEACGDRRVPRARRDRVLRLLRARARADVLPHRGLGPRQPALRGDEVLPVHRRPAPRSCSSGILVGRVPAPARDRPPHLRRAARSPRGRRRAHAMSSAASRSGCSSRSRSASR